MKRFVFLFSLFASSIVGSNIYAQGKTSTIEIFLKDSVSGTPIQQANAIYQSLDGKIKGYTASDEKGILKISCSESKTILSISCVGYKPMRDTLQIEPFMSLFLVEDIFNLEQVTVTGTRTPRTLKEAPVLTQMISQSEIKSTSSQTIKDILEVEMPSVEMSRHGFGASITSQGLGAQYILFLVDGERMAGETDGNIDFSRINAANIEQVEVVRGASSALYGSNAMGGVINIITKKPRKKWDISFDAQYAQNNQENVKSGQLSSIDEGYLKTFYSNQDWKNLNGNLSVGYRSGAFYTNTYLGFKSMDAYQLFDTKGQKKYYPSIDSSVVDPVSKTPTDIDGFMDYTLSNKTGFSISKSINAELRGSYYNHEQFDFTRDSKHNLFRDYSLGGSLDKKITEVSALRLSYNIDTYNKYDVLEKKAQNDLNYGNTFSNVKVTYSGRFTDKHSILAGFENLYESLSTDMFIYGSLTRKSVNDVVAVLEDEYKVAGRFTMTLGLRSGFHSTFNGHLSPSVTLKYTQKSFSYRLSYARGYRSPSLKELYMNWDHLGMFTIIGSESLKPEVNNYYSFSVDYVNTSKRINFTLITSYNHVMDKIGGVWSNNETEYRYSNAGDYRVFVSELLMKWRTLRCVSLKSGYVYTKTFSDSTSDISTVSPHAFTAQVEYIYKKGNYQITTNFAGKVTGAKKYEVLDDNIALYYRVKYPIYSLWDLTINQQFYNRFTLKSGVKNLFDYKAPIITYNTSATPGRRFFVSLIYEF